MEVWKDGRLKTSTGLSVRKSLFVKNKQLSNLGTFITEKKKNLV